MNGPVVLQVSRICQQPADPKESCQNDLSLVKTEKYNVMFCNLLQNYQRKGKILEIKLTNILYASKMDTK